MHGNNPVNSGTAIETANQGTTVNIILNATQLDDTFNLTCSEYDTCIIDCRKDVCLNIILTCFGKCYVKCKYSDTPICINPSNIGQYILWQSESPTQYPSNYPSNYPTKEPTQYITEMTGSDENNSGGDSTSTSAASGTTTDSSENNSNNNDNDSSVSSNDSDIIAIVIIMSLTLIIVVAIVIFASVKIVRLITDQKQQILQISE